MAQPIIRKSHLKSALQKSRNEVLTLNQAAADDIDALDLRVDTLESFRLYLDPDGDLCQSVS